MSGLRVVEGASVIVTIRDNIDAPIDRDASIGPYYRPTNYRNVKVEPQRCPLAGVGYVIGNYLRETDTFYWWHELGGTEKDAMEAGEMHLPPWRRGA